MTDIDFVISNTVNFPGSAGLPIINDDPLIFVEDFPSLYGNVNFSFDVTFSLTDTSEAAETLTVTDLQLTDIPEFLQYEIISSDTIRISAKPDTVVFTGEIFELLLSDQIVLTGELSGAANTNIIQGTSTKFTEELQPGDNIILGRSSLRFTVNNIVNNTDLEVDTIIDTDFDNEFFILANILDIAVGDPVSAGSYKTILQWIEPTIKELIGSYTFTISYIGSISGPDTIGTTHIQEFYWYYVPSLEKFETLIAGSLY